MSGIYITALKDYTTEELKEELWRRNSPQLIVHMDFSDLVIECKNHIFKLASNLSTEDDEHYIYEIAMEAVYGNHIWDWINERS